MRRVAYAEAVIGMDDRVADLVLQYAALLASGGSAATVVVPAVVGDRGVVDVTLLLGPASQMAAWRDDQPFPGDPTDAIALLRDRIAELTTGMSQGEVPPLEVEEFDGLEGSTDPDGFGRD